jgi:hypothetical protein
MTAQAVGFEGLSVKIREVNLSPSPRCKYTTITLLGSQDPTSVKSKTINTRNKYSENNLPFFIEAILVYKNGLISFQYTRIKIA